MLYFPILGRGEPIRMTLAACGVEYVEEAVDFGKMKDEAGTATSPFGQAPFFEAEGVRLAQMVPIMRYIAAKNKPELVGGSAILAAQSDMLLNGIDDLYLKYISCVYKQGLEDAAKEELWKTHFEAASKAGQNGGGHLFYLVSALKRSGGPFLTGSQVTISDIFFYFTLEAYVRDQCFGKAKIFGEYPDLEAYMGSVATVDGLKTRLADPKRAEMGFNGNGKG